MNWNVLDKKGQLTDKGKVLRKSKWDLSFAQLGCGTAWVVQDACAARASHAVQYWRVNVFVWYGALA